MLHNGIKHKGVIFTDSLIPALLSGAKVQTRRPVSSNVLKKIRLLSDLKEIPPLDAFRKFPEAYQSMVRHFCPLGQVGDLIYARETYLPDPPSDHEAWSDDDSIHTHYSWAGCGSKVSEVPQRLRHPDYVIYRATWEYDPAKLCWRPSIHMPKWASRIWLEVTDVSFEPLMEITPADALAEGIEHRTMNDPRYEFYQLWDQLYGDGKHAENPYVWAVKFRRVERPDVVD